MHQTVSIYIKQNKPVSISMYVTLCETETPFRISIKYTQTSIHLADREQHLFIIDHNRHS
jgi:hypothetical protein